MKEINVELDFYLSKFEWNKIISYALSLGKNSSITCSFGLHRMVIIKEAPIYYGRIYVISFRLIENDVKIISAKLLLSDLYKTEVSPNQVKEEILGFILFPLE